MKLIALTVLYAFLSTPAVLENGQCSACKRWHVTSTVTMNNYGLCTLMGCGTGMYREDGTYIAPQPCNTCYSSGMCSRGHRVTNTWMSF